MLAVPHSRVDRASPNSLAICTCNFSDGLSEVKAVFREPDLIGIVVEVAKYTPRLRLKRNPLITNLGCGKGLPSLSSRMTIAEAPLYADVAALITSAADVGGAMGGSAGSGATKL